MAVDPNGFARWNAEIEHAQKDDKYRRWLDQSDKIVKRYRDQRNTAGSADVGRRKYNVLWANVQTLGPAVYGNMPKPIAERRFLDRDPSARLASLILERTLSFQMDMGGFHAATDKAVLDYLLPGMGQIWLRYEAAFESAEVLKENDEIEGEEEAESPNEAEDDGLGEPEDKLSFESICFDYVYYRDFLWSPARSWAEVPWVAKRTWEDKASCEEKFGKRIASQIIYGDPKNKDLAGIASNEPMTLGKSKKAEIWEIWCKPERKVYFIATDSPDLILKEQDDPLNLEAFWPCPPPLFTTQTNDTLIPVPDYIEYQDQASELDDLTDRISQITTAVKATGVYNSEYKDLARLLQEGGDNRLVPVDQWAAFAENGGLKGSIDLIPMDVIMAVLTELYAARDHVLQDIYQITGMSDILRGASDPAETATAQNIKANYATGRLGSRQERVAEFCAETVKIAAELIAEIFSDESLAEMSGYDQICAERVKAAVEALDPPAPPSPPQPKNGQPAPPVPPQMQALQQRQAQQQFQQLQQQTAQQVEAQCKAEFDAALKILRSDKLRGFRVAIETDSTIADALQQDKTAAQEYITGLFSSLQGAEAIVGQAPELVKPLGESIMWASRKMRVGRTLESAWEDAFDKLEKRVEEMQKNPQPSPDMMKVQADIQVSQAQAEATNVRAQAEQAKSQAATALAAAKLQSEQQSQALQTRIDQLTLQLDAIKSSVENETDLERLRMESATKVLVALINKDSEQNGAELSATVEALLGLAKMNHEKDMQSSDQAATAAASAQAQQPSQGAATDSGGASRRSSIPVLPMFVKKTDQQHQEHMKAIADLAQKQQEQDARHAQQMAALHQHNQQMAQVMGQVAGGLHALAQAHGSPKRVVFDPQTGRPVGIENVH